MGLLKKPLSFDINLYKFKLQFKKAMFVAYIYVLIISGEGLSVFRVLLSSL